MRYDIPKFIYQYGQLPAGDDERIRNGPWGISYGFTPVLSYMVSALFMKIASLFSTDDVVLLTAARLVSICFSLGTVCFCSRIGSMLFDKVYAKLFVAATVLLPQFVFISSYVNTDAFGIFTVSWIIYAMLCARSHRWRLRDCVFLGAGIGLCLLSYYNCYGIIVAALIYSAAAVLCDKEIDGKFRFILTRTLWVFLVAALISGWWFLRNFLLYDGDILGLLALSECKELYAAPLYKPSAHDTPQRMGVSLPYMIFEMRWLSQTVLSFIGVFDYMQLYLHPSVYYCVKLLFALGLGGWLMHVFPCLQTAVPYRRHGHIMPWRRQEGRIERPSMLLHVSMMLMCGITTALSLYYSYTLDFQAQGRYLLPMLIPLNILLVHGWQKLADKLLHEKKDCAAAAFMAVYVMTIFSATLDTLLPAYR